MQRAVLFWSGGKDSGLALDRVRRSNAFEVVALITTVNAEYHRVSMHGVREALIDRQADAIGIPVHKMYVSSRSSNDEYVQALRIALTTFKERGVGHVIFGDIFLEDLRQWRETLLGQLGMAGVFPLWKADTRELSDEFVARGFKAIVCCVNDAHLNESDVGCALDADFFRRVPPGVDPCGENGEYHTFLYDGPIFTRPIQFEVGERVYRPLLSSAEVSSPAPSDSTADLPPLITSPAASGPGTTRGFWFIDLREVASTSDPPPVR